MASKQVTDRQKIAEAVVAVGEVQAETVSQALQAWLQPHLQQGETMPDFSLMMRLMTRSLRASRAAMIAADAAHEAELADDPPARQDRDVRAKGLYGRMVELRELLRGVYGSPTVHTVMPHQTPLDPVVLSRFAGEVIAALAAAELPTPRIAGASLDRAALVAELESLRAALDTQLATVAQEMREAQATLVAKTRAMEVHDRVYAGVATTMSGLLQLAGEHELARRVRPTRRRAGQVPVGELPVSTPDTSEPAPVP